MIADTDEGRLRVSDKANSGERKTRRRRKVRRPTISTTLIALSVVICVGVVAEIAHTVITLAVGNRGYGGPQTAPMEEETEAEAAPSARRVSFCAVGDNLINEEGDYTVDLLGLADSWDGEVGDGSYDFTPLYEKVKPTISSYDIALVNQETVLGGTGSFEYQGFPSYNTPDEVAPALADAGFDVVNCNTNHTFDLWTDAIEHAQATWAKQGGVSVIGSYASEADRSDIRVVEANGLKVAFLSYSYGQNGYTQDELPNDYYAAPIDRDKMRSEIEAAQKIADAVVVYMHWGDENTFELNEEQRDISAFLAGMGVDLTIGSHAHVIQPVSYVARGIPTTDGSGADASNGMLCVYGLGDFVSGYTLPKTILSGMFTCDIVAGESGEVSIENPVWHALIEHNEGDTDAVYELSGYTEEMAQRNRLLDRVGEDGEGVADDRLSWARETTQEVVGDAIAIAM